MSATVYQAIYFFEVALRNAIDEQLRPWKAGETIALGSRLTTEWCYEPAPLLDRLARKDIDGAYARAEKELHIKHGAGARRPNHDDVIAQTNLGLWRYLLPSSSDAGKQVLWAQAVSKAFPNLSRPSSQLVDAVHGVYLIRNRIAHLEPLIDQNVAAHYKNMITVMGDVSRDLQSWFASVTPEVSMALAARPTFATQN